MIKKLPLHLKKKKGGYLLMEILVSLTIFSIIVTTSVGAVLAIVDANAKSQSTKSVIDNLSVALENITRTIRIGTDYKCIISSRARGAPQEGNSDGLCSQGNEGISFIPQDAESTSDRVEYYFYNGAIYRYRPSKTESALTAPEVTITAMKFYLYGAGTNDGQPRVFVVVNGTAGPEGKRQTTFTIQSTVTQRESQEIINPTGTQTAGAGGSPIGNCGKAPYTAGTKTFGDYRDLQVGKTYLLELFDFASAHRITLNSYDPVTGYFEGCGDAGNPTSNTSYADHELISGHIGGSNNPTYMHFDSQYYTSDNTVYTYSWSGDGTYDSTGQKYLGSSSEAGTWGFYFTDSNY
jgi:type II secretory pathway pseudopilin PulG